MLSKNCNVTAISYDTSNSTFFDFPPLTKYTSKKFQFFTLFFVEKSQFSEHVPEFFKIRD